MYVSPVTVLPVVGTMSASGGEGCTGGVWGLGRWGEGLYRVPSHMPEEGPSDSEAGPGSPY